MKKCLVVVSICIVIFSGCFYQADLRPFYNNEDIWVCDTPYAEFYWDDDGEYGMITVEKNVYQVILFTTAGPQIFIFDREMKSEGENIINYDYCLFRGYTTYGKKSFTIEVEEDYKNIFGGEKPVMKFVKYNKEKYFNGKNIAK